MTSIDWRDAAEELAADTPWVLAAIAAGVLVAVLLVGYLTFSRISSRKAQQEQQHCEAVMLAQKEGLPPPAEPLRMDPRPLLGGIAVSLYGLWGFATETLDLPLFFAVGFVSMFDVLQLRLFGLMYKSADPQKGWTPQLRLLQATAWAFVTASAVANIAHAPNAIAAPFMALMPIGAAWVIQLDLRRALAGKEAEVQEQQTVKPGPFRLLGLLWRRLWGWCFRVLGLDVTDRADTMVRRARARDAADASYELRKALKEKEQLETAGGAGQRPRGRGKLTEEQKRLTVLNRRLEKKIRPRAQAALELAETRDPEQGLELMQRMAWLTRADDVALLDYGPDSTAMELLEELNIAANADFVRSAKRAKDAERLAEEANRSREAAEAAVEEAEARLEDLSGQIEKAQADAEKTAESVADEIEAETRTLKALREERERLENSGASASQLHQTAVQELREAREELKTVRDDAQAASRRVATLEGEQTALRARLEELGRERDGLADKASKAADRARTEREKSLRLEARLAQLESGTPAGVPAAARRPGRVDARVPGGTHSGTQGGTRQRIRGILAAMTPAELEEAKGPRGSVRELARWLIQEKGLDVGEDSVRGHIAAIEQEAQEQQAQDQVPDPDDKAPA